MTKSVCAIGLMGLGIVALQSVAAPSAAMHQQAAATYEHLATAIIEIRATEDNLVKGILMHYHALAARELAEAVDTEGSARAGHLEAAAAEISNIANEGDKQVQAVRQRLLKAGHHHHTDAETKDDYMFVDGKEKRELVDLAGKVAKLGASASSADIKTVSSELDECFARTIADE